MIKYDDVLRLDLELNIFIIKYYYSLYKVVTAYLTSRNKTELLINLHIKKLILTTINIQSSGGCVHMRSVSFNKLAVGGTPRGDKYSSFYKTVILFVNTVVEIVREDLFAPLLDTD